MMPNYDYKCEKCGKIEERFARINEQLLVCSCGGIMVRLFSPPIAIIPDIEPYLDENLAGQDGRPVYVKSRRHKKELLKERGLAQRR